MGEAIIIGPEKKVTCLRTCGTQKRLKLKLIGIGNDFLNRTQKAQ
jgi:hypothetical protein